ncbi:MAG: flagellar hook-length control protein FliK [Proteobacteria bacterium]|nr:flagellar hook-length control protein FliK [Pseudomonadota bacterium]MBU1416954.1 flagellar hook-length control protein FliK [Pseudomonadota bacterium]
MEAFLLSPNAPAQKPMQAQNQKNTSESNKGGFAPLLNETINNRESRQIPTESVASQDTEQNEETNIDDTEIIAESSDIPETDVSSDALVLANLLSSMEDSPEIPLSSKSNHSPVTSVSVKSEHSPETSVSVKSEHSPETSVSIKSEQADFFQQRSSQNQLFTIGAVREDSQSELQPLAPLIQKGSGENISPPSKAETLLLQQIQQLLNEGQNKGPITIKNTTQQSTAGQAQAEELQKLTSPALLSTKNGEILAQQTFAAVTVEEGKSFESSRSVKLEGNRQDITGQYLSAKIGGSDSKDSKTANQFQQSGSEQQTSGEQNKNGSQPVIEVISSSLSPANSGESASGFQFSLNTASSDQTSIEGKYIPGSQVTVPEKEIVNQLIQRFSVNPRLQTSKISMQLHPAELGEIKIDIQVKEGSIKANIVAQSQQVLDTLEKNMPRLRTLLENQGFTVDSFKITMDSDGGRQQQHFQENFSSQQQESFFTRSSAKETESFGLVLNNIDEPAVTATGNPGVNVTV